MNRKVIPDLQARAEALDVHRSFLVQAPAGSGKTELLIQRCLALLAGVEEPESVVAITFTRKAAGEMRGRIVQALEQAVSGQEPKEAHEKQTRALACAVLARDRERGWNLRQMPARLRIQTIDSLCAAIAHSLPAVSGFGGTLEVVESPEEFYAEAAHATVLLLGSESPRESEAVVGLLQHLDSDVGKVESLLAAMLQQRDQWLRHVGSGTDTSGVRESLDEILSRIVCRCLRHLKAAVPAVCVDELVELAAFAAAQQKNELRPVRRCLQISELPGIAAADREAWVGIASLLLTSSREWRSTGGINASVGFPAGGAERLRMQDLLTKLRPHDALLAALQEVCELPPSQIDDQQWPIIAALFCLLPRAVAELKRLFAERGQVDFSEVAQAASRALGTPEAPTDLALALGCRIEHLLVDEYQDTSVTQQELLEKLTAGWEPGDGRTLFLVGDPMQSIYRFRQAEVGLFINAAQSRSLGTIALHPLQLTANFRSCPEIVGWVNAAFPQVFPAADDVARSAVAYTASTAMKESVGPRAVWVHPFIGGGAEVREAEADRVVSLIEDARARNSHGTIAVLVRARSHLAALVPKLRQRAQNDDRFRFCAVDIDSLAERQIVLDLVSLTRALLHLADRIAWLSVLRAPWCGVALADLYALCAAENHSCIWDLLSQPTPEVSPDGAQRMARLRQGFAPALEHRGRQPLAHSVRGLWLSLGGPACCRGTDLEDATTFFDLLEELECTGELTTAQLSARLKDLFANPDPGADGRLQLLTIHKAKGLEFDTVILPGLGRRPRREDPRLLLWLERASPDGEPELLLAPIKKKGGDDDPLYRFIQRMERERGAEEGKRLLYVGATRAITQLHLLGHAEVNRDGELQVQANSLLHDLWPVVKSEFEQAFLPGASLQIAAAAAPSAPELKRLPGSWKAPECPPPLPGAQPVSVTELQISFDWASDTVRHIGTVTHALLHKMAREGVEQWSAATVAAHGEAIRTALAGQGVIAAELERAAVRVETALRQTIADPKGRWVLGNHAEARSEYPVSGVANGQARHFKLDRTFVEDGVRWIIDFKTGEREGAGRDAFADAEVERYREQLTNYARVLANLDPRPIRLGLYFPLLGAWRECKLAVET